MMNHIMRFVRDEEGATAVEYGLLVGLVAAAIIGAVTALGTSVSQTFNNLSASMGGAGGIGAASGSGS